MKINLKKKIRQTLKSMKHAKAACRKKYIDWEDNCFNCLDSKFIWGYAPGLDTEPSFCSCNLAQVYFNRATKKYYMDIDTGFYNVAKDEEFAWCELERLTRIDFAFRDFLIENNLKLRDPNIPCFYSPDFQLNLEADCLTTLYTKFRIMLEGYKMYREGVLKTTKESEINED